MESDVIYFRRRADEEYLAANYAGPFVAFRAHRELAARFTDLADAIEAAERSFDAKTDDAPGSAAEAEHEQQRATLWV
jgi:hypothetical protein